MKKYLPYVSWATLVIACLTLGGVVYASMWIRATALEKGKNALSSDERASQAAYMSRIHALASETKNERDALEFLTQADIVSIANAIEAAGNSIGVKARVSAAIPSGSPIGVPGGTPIHAVAFIIQAEGSFAGVTKLVKVFESFPMFSTVEQFDIERAQIEGANTLPWRTTIRLRILTTSEISI